MFNKFFVYFLVNITVILHSQPKDSVNIASSQVKSDSLFIDSNSIAIDSTKILQPEKTKIILQQPFFDQSYFISRTDILRNDYRYAGDFFKVFPFSFERSYGFIGQPNDIYLYTEGSSSSSYFMDGVPIRVSDFNHIQSEDIDSIEIVPLPRGFLYGFTTNPVSVNFISKDIIPTKPYSRIKYYQGPFGEAFIDGIFSINLFKDLIASVDITNRKVDDSYKNSAFSIWQTKAKLRYNLSNDVDLVGSYYFSKSTTGINGGVNVDEIRQTTSDINSELYNETLAPVNYENNSLDFKQHNFGLKILTNPFENSYTNINFYYKFYQNEYNAVDTLVKSKSTSKDKLLGAILDQRFVFNPIHVSLQSGYQSLKHNPTFTSSDSLNVAYLLDNSNLYYKTIFISPMLSVTLFDSMVVPSIFYKHANIIQRNGSAGIDVQDKFNGFCTDLSIYLNENFTFYFGYSKFDNNYFVGEEINTLEMKLAYRNEYGRLGASIFYKKSTSTNLWGIGFDLSHQIWKILLEGRLSQYFVEKGSLEVINLPETKFTAGVYYKDLLFNSNLDLIAGFVANYTGKQNLRNLPILHWGILSDDVESWLTIDFTVSAEIQKTALVYFTWENLFDKQYYITPYYPMLERNIRFGVAWEIFN